MSSDFGLKRGTMIGQYRIIRRLGAGGMGVVYEAFQEALNRRVAIKMVYKETTENPDAMKRFEVEGRALGRVNHRNVVAVYNLGQFESAPYLAMEYVEGITLKDYLNKRVFPVKKAIPLFRQLLQGVEALHKSGIIHRDLKPQNVIYQENHEVKIVDFGIAKLIQETSDEITDAGVIVGSAKYIAPEIAEKESATIQSDIWSLGVLFYYMLVGVTPFDAANEKDVLENVKNVEIKFPVHTKILIPRELRYIILKMLTRPLDKRYANTSQVIKKLEEYVKMAGPSAEYHHDSNSDKALHLNIKDEEALVAELKGLGYDQDQTKIVLTLALNEQTKMDSGNPNFFASTKIADGTEVISISDIALEAAMNLLDQKNEVDTNVGMLVPPKISRFENLRGYAKPRYAVLGGLALAFLVNFIVNKILPPPEVPRSVAVAPQPTPQPKIVKQVPAPVPRPAPVPIPVSKPTPVALPAPAPVPVYVPPPAPVPVAKPEPVAKQIETIKWPVFVPKPAPVAKKVVVPKAQPKVIAKAPPKVVKPKREVAAVAPVEPSKPVEAEIVKLVQPEILSPAAGTSVSSSPGAPPTMIFMWKPQDGAKSYEIEYSLSGSFTDAFLKQTVKKNQFMLNRALPYGTIYWRVRAAADSKTFSEWSPTQNLTIALPE